jgi:hypothetical protein
MIRLKHALSLLTVAIAMSACQDSPTAPAEITSLNAPRLTITADPTLVTFNSASCSLADAATGSVHCSWNIANPAETHLNLWAQAIVTASYNCINPKNGRVSSTERRDQTTLIMQSDVSSPALTGRDEALPAPALYNDYTGKNKKLNACSGSNVPQSLTWSLSYWNVGAITVSGALRMNCYASDNRDGCFTL